MNEPFINNLLVFHQKLNLFKLNFCVFNKFSIFLKEMKRRYSFFLFILDIKLFNFLLLTFYYYFLLLIVFLFIFRCKIIYIY